MFLMMALFGACKKSTKDTPAPLSATAKLDAVLKAGNGVWQISSYTETYYDSNNNVLQTLTPSLKGYYIFEDNDIEQRTMTYPKMTDANNTLTSYSLSIEGNVQYITTGTAGSVISKAELEVLTASAVSLSSVDSTPAAIEVNGAIVNPDHGLVVLNLTKYTGN